VLTAAATLGGLQHGAAADAARRPTAAVYKETGPGRRAPADGCHAVLVGSCMGTRISTRCRRLIATVPISPRPWRVTIRPRRSAISASGSVSVAGTRRQRAARWASNMRPLRPANSGQHYNSFTAAAGGYELDLWDASATRWQPPEPRRRRMERDLESARLSLQAQLTETTSCCADWIHRSPC